jgi:hypothetical protein
MSQQFPAIAQRFRNDVASTCSYFVASSVCKKCAAIATWLRSDFSIVAAISEGLCDIQLLHVDCAGLSSDNAVIAQRVRND